MTNIDKRINEHYEKAVELKGESRVFGVMLQGSQNYNLSYENSDIDSKCIILPNLKDIVLNKKPISTTYIMENEEHLDLKDIRLMFDCFKKQNINFIEILFTDYFKINPLYKDEWQKLRDNAELIAKYSKYKTLKCIKGTSLEKLHALKHPYPSKIDVINKHGYDPKQLHHILRLDEFLTKYLSDYSYYDCLKSSKRDYLIDVKKGKLSLKEAELLASEKTEQIVQQIDTICKNMEQCDYNPEASKILDNLCYEIIKKSLIYELNK